ncbi:hypothetical protein K1719_007543 [Acacia pycnantha]|nr:hypothetical protein K1719_007543 [Acacia pycnantha]
MGSVAGGGSKPHAVFTPFPAQGHVNSGLQLAKLLHLRGFFITFVNTEFNHKRLLRSRGVETLQGLPDFRFETIPDGLSPPTNDNAHQDLPSLCDSTRKNCLLPFQNLLGRLSESASSGLIPPVTCLISDVSMYFTIDAAEALGHPIILFCPVSTYSLLGYAHYQNLLDRGLVPLKDESYLTNGYLEHKIDWIPGMRHIKLKDLPTFLRTTDPNDLLFHFIIELTKEAHRATAICFHTFDELEGEAVKALSFIYSIPLYTIGPYPSFLSQIQQTDQLLSLKSNLWKEETQCLDWLELKEPRSVLYVNFGSWAIISPEQLYFSFLWIIRPDLVSGSSSVILSPEFLTEIEDRGVPMACWPFFADQQTNCRYACKDWGIGVEIDSNVKREEVEKLVNELMDGEKGKKMGQKGKSFGL